MTQTNQAPKTGMMTVAEIAKYLREKYVEFGGLTPLKEIDVDSMTPGDAVGYLGRLKATVDRQLAARDKQVAKPAPAKPAISDDPEQLLREIRAMEIVVWGKTFPVNEGSVKALQVYHQQLTPKLAERGIDLEAAILVHDIRSLEGELAIDESPLDGKSVDELKAIKEELVARVREEQRGNSNEGHAQTSTSAADAEPTAPVGTKTSRKPRPGGKRDRKANGHHKGGDAQQAS